MKNLYEQTEQSEDSKLPKESNPVLQPNNISKIVVDTLVDASKSNDTKKRLEDALSKTPVSKDKIAKALMPDQTLGSKSTKRNKPPKGAKGTTGTGSKER